MRAKAKASKRRTVYASLYQIADQKKLKAHVIVITNKNGELEASVAGPVTIGDWYLPRIRKKEAAQIVWYYLKDSYPHKKIGLEDIKLYPFRKANELLFKLENK